jgi:hypothetical protein
VRPPGGYRNFDQPPGITTAVIDPTTGLLATDACPYAVTEVYPRGAVPRSVCDVHRRWDFFDYFTERRGRDFGDGGRRDGGWEGGSDGRPGPPPGARAEEERRVEQPGAEVVRERERGFRRWVRRVFGGEDDQRREAEPAEEEDDEGQEEGPEVP